MYGAGGHAKVIIDIIDANRQKIHAIYDDNPGIKETMGINVVRPDKKMLENEPNVVAIGNNKIRKKVGEAQTVKYVEFLVHAAAFVSASAKIEKGTVVMANTSINAEAGIGQHCIINTGAVVEYDASSQDFMHISPQASIAGNVKIGEGTHVGIGAVIIPGIKIGKWATIGTGAVIIEDLPNFAVVGNPGKIIRFEEIS